MKSTAEASALLDSNKLNQLNQALFAYVQAKVMSKDGRLARSFGLRGPADWVKLNNPLVQNKILIALAADNPLLAGLIDTVLPTLGHIAGKGLSWVGNKVGSFFGLHPKTVEVAS